MPDYNKVPLNAPQQVAHLQAKGMNVADVRAAELFLSRVGFYRFKGYAHQFKDPATKSYVAADFDQIREIMEFDDWLRLHVLRGIQVLEIGLRTLINEHMTLTHHPHWYADPKVMPRERTVDRRARRMRTSAEELAPRAYSAFLQSSDDSPRHYRNAYDAWTLPPSWMMTEILSFGLWSKIYASLEQPDRAAISLTLAVHERDLQVWLQDLTVLRNISAHHSRLWNRVFRPARLYEPDPVLQPLRTHSYRPLHPETTLAPRLYAMHALLTTLGERRWSRDLRLVNRIPSALLGHVGFRPGWEAHPTWN